MRQVPSYAIIGNGRMARHTCHYLSALSIAHQQWSRQSNTSLNDFIHDHSHILLLISDKAIEDFIRDNRCLRDKMLVHFSGQLTTPLAYSAHPLMTFSDELYATNIYHEIAFVIEKDGPSFAELCPGLPNSSYAIPAAQKSLYHSLCVLSGNFTTILWQKVFREFEQQLNLPREILQPYLQKVMSNLQSEQRDVLTGPLARNDAATIDSNLTALNGDPFQEVYKAFVNAYEQEKV